MISMKNDRLKQQLAFLQEIDKLKTVIRRNNLIADPSRFENSAEHSWHLAFYAMTLAEYANEPVDVTRVMKMVLLHDLVEIDAGDVFCYDDQGKVGVEDRETMAAQRLFGLLPADQKQELMSLWQEFEARETPEAKFAVVVDRIHPLIHNYVTNGGSWKRHQIKREQVDKRMSPIKEGSTELANLINQLVDDAVAKEYLLP